MNKSSTYSSHTITQRIEQYLSPSTSSIFLSLKDRQFLDEKNYELILCLADLLDNYHKHEIIKLYKLLYLLLCICLRSLKNDQKEQNLLQKQYKNLLNQYNFKTIFCKRFGHTLDSGQKVIIRKICDFLDCYNRIYEKNQLVIRLKLVHSIISDHHEYRLLQMFKKMLKDNIEICQKQFSVFINQTVSKTIKTVIVPKKMQFRKMSKQQIIEFYEICSLMKVIRIKINHLKCKYLKISQDLSLLYERQFSEDLTFLEELTQIYNNFIKDSTKSESEKLKKQIQVINISVLQQKQNSLEANQKEEIQQDQPKTKTNIQKTMNTTIPKVKRNLKAMNAMIKQMQS